mmetsp:Transcript_4616/g.13260  ORF Transcript_4616/g.13260 Transcript_4616/m.13260 type:complete len:226 (-) Transcript_4616:606-1283(-)|eukprot:CAMPEP_0206142122 /NCGR_PEP_ID=MMETSP1473-20131121/15688_1 /ASSEMBLY_ACC=CAM_ASM_001109 /TAXON_ID=1461547 /ORGANISM="Stichococcus sp, Strain RCC1054" /LENGTH=225 /DNA_ID=CAMNT_0053536991 /DNA_START=124 /DNA_END=801 /DNA_ORIENTATION=+
MMSQCGALTGSQAPSVLLPRKQVQQPLQRQARQTRRALVVRAGGQVSTNDFKNGMMIEVDSQPFRVTEFLHVKPGKGSAFVRTKLKNQISGNSVERTFRAGEMVGLADVYRSEVQYTYQEGKDYVFMDNSTYEETRLAKDPTWANWLKEGADCILLKWGDRVIDVMFPSAHVELKVISCSPPSNATGSSKPATLETGATVEVPQFINEGEIIRIDHANRKYLGRA